MPQKYDPSAIEQAMKALENPPGPDKEQKVTGRQIVESLHERITGLYSSGHTYEQISELLSGTGIVIAPSTLSGYVREIARERKREANRQKRLAKQDDVKPLKTVPLSTAKATGKSSSKKPLSTAPNVITGELVDD